MNIAERAQAVVMIRAGIPIRQVCYASLIITITRVHNCFYFNINKEWRFSEFSVNS